MTSYCTLSDAKNAMKANTVNSTDEPVVERLIRQVSNRIDSVMGSRHRPFFAPYQEQRKYHIVPKRINQFDDVFWLNDYILAFTAVLKDTETITSIVELYADNNNLYTGLHYSSTGYSWYSSEDPPNFIYVTGTWGWHEDWNNAWDSVDTVQDAGGISASATSITVADADGEDSDGFTPRFSPGHLLKIGSEYLDVLAVNTTTNVLTVRRGRNGTTATAHAINTAIATYTIDDRIKRITARQVASMYGQRGAYLVESLDGLGAGTYPQDLLPELRSVLAEFMYG